MRLTFPTAAAVLAALLLAPAFSAPAAAAKTGERPSLVVILADDQ